jgi:hypothetical protein
MLKRTGNRSARVGTKTKQAHYPLLVLPIPPACLVVVVSTRRARNPESLVRSCHANGLPRVLPREYPATRVPRGK